MQPQKYFDPIVKTQILLMVALNVTSGCYRRTQLLAVIVRQWNQQQQNYFKSALYPVQLVYPVPSTPSTVSAQLKEGTHQYLYYRQKAIFGYLLLQAS